MILNEQELPYQIGLTLIPNIGDVLAKNLISYCGSAQEVFNTKEGLLKKIPGIGEFNARRVIQGKACLTRANEEIEFIRKYNIEPLFYTDPNYPQRLKHCTDGPILLYHKGNTNFNTQKVVSVVGTRTPDDYGKEMTQHLINDLKGSGILVVSGLAYGIDIQAHKSALDNNLSTVGVVAHGLDRVYPGGHTAMAKKMVMQGGLLTDFISGTNPDAVNFPKRNRIVAGICDAIVIVQSKKEGGSLITATIASSYNKDVFAFPGKANDVLSEGCNGLIKRNKAGLIESAADLLDAMNWLDKQEKPKNNQIPLSVDLNEEQTSLTKAFATKKEMHLDEICYATEKSISKISTLLLELEFKNLIKSKPGKMYEYLG